MNIFDLKPSKVKATINEYMLPFLMMITSSVAILTPMLAPKIAKIGFLKFSGSLIAIMIAYGVIDIINEIWGKKTAQATALLMIFIRLVAYILLIPLIISLPTAFAPTGYAKIMTFSLKSLFASELSVFVATLVVDIPIFDRLKRADRLPFIVRTNLSSFFAAIIGTLIAITITYWGTGQDLVQLTLTQLVTKFILMFAISLVTTMLVHSLRDAGFGKKVNR